MICHPSLILNIPTVRNTRLRAGCALFVAALCCLPGCSTEDPRLESLREQFVLRTEPTEPTTIADAKAKLAEDPHVKFVGRVAADECQAFTRSKASFLVTEILPDEHGHVGKDHADNCPFCKRKAAEAPRAAVQFVDEAGETLAVDARKLFSIEPGDTAVIRGTGELVTELDVFVVTADGIYLQSREVQ